MENELRIPTEQAVSDLIALNKKIDESVVKVEGLIKSLNDYGINLSKGVNSAKELREAETQIIKTEQELIDSRKKLIEYSKKYKELEDKTTKAYWDKILAQKELIAQAKKESELNNETIQSRKKQSDAIKQQQNEEKELIRLIKEEEKALKSFNSEHSKALDLNEKFNAQKTKDELQLRANVAKNATKAIDDLNKAFDKLNKEEEKKVNTTKTLNAEIEKTIKLTREEKAVIQANSIINDENAGTREKLIAKHKLLSIEQNKVNQTTAEGSARYKEIIHELNTLDGAIYNNSTIAQKQVKNIGNYTNANWGLSNSINQLTREIPAFTYSAQTGFMAISNNIPMFVDQINNAREANKQLREDGQKTVPVWKQLASSIFSWQTALSVGIALTTVYGKEIANYVSNLFKSNEALEANKILQDDINQLKKEAIKKYNDEKIGLETLFNVYKNTNNSLSDRKLAFEELKKQAPGYFANLQFEEKVTNKITEAYNSATNAMLRKAMTEAYYSKISENSKKLVDLEDEIKLSKQLYENAQVYYELNRKTINSQNASINLSSTKSKLENQQKEYENIKNANKLLTDKIESNQILDLQAKKREEDAKKEADALDKIKKEAEAKLKKEKEAKSDYSKIAQEEIKLEQEKYDQKLYIYETTEKHIDEFETKRLLEKLANLRKYVNEQRKLGNISEYEQIKALNDIDKKEEDLFKNKLWYGNEEAEQAKQLAELKRQLTEEEKAQIKELNQLRDRQNRANYREREKELDFVNNASATYVVLTGRRQKFINDTDNLIKTTKEEIEVQKKLNSAYDSGALEKYIEGLEQLKTKMESVETVTADVFAEVLKTYDMITSVVEAYYDRQEKRMELSEKRQINIAKRQMKEQIALGKSSTEAQAEYELKLAKIQSESAYKKDMSAWKRAKREKDETMVRINLANSEAVMRTAADSGWYAAIGVAAAGTAALIVAGSQPLPDKPNEADYYWKGTMNHGGGDAVVNDRGLGREMIIEPSGRSYIPFGEDVFLPNLPKGSMVIPADITRDIVGNNYSTSTVDISKVENYLAKMSSKQGVTLGVNAKKLGVFTLETQRINNRINYLKGKR